MDLGNAQISYDDMEPAYKDKDKIEELAEMYEKEIRQAIVLDKKYECRHSNVGSIEICPIDEISDVINSDTDILEGLISDVISKKSSAEIGKKFAVILNKIVKQIALSAAEDHASSE